MARSTAPAHVRHRTAQGGQERRSGKGAVGTQPALASRKRVARVTRGFLAFPAAAAWS